MAELATARTWILTLCGADAVVQECADPSGAITAVRSFERASPTSAAESNAIVSGDPQLAKIAEWLERERAARSYQRLSSSARPRGCVDCSPGCPRRCSQS